MVVEIEGAANSGMARRKLEEAEDPVFAQKLEELRIEVHKRDMMRKFEAINNASY